MQPLQKVLSIIALLFLITNTARIAYDRWIEARTSPADAVGLAAVGKIDPTLKSQIESAQKVEELIGRYKLSANQREELKAAGRTDETLETTVQILQGAINEWTSDAKKVRELTFFWFVGFAVFLAGLVTYKLVNRWLGTALLIVAFFEFIYWTVGESGLSYTWARVRQFNVVLTYKFVFSTVSLALLFTTVFMLDVFRDSDRGGRV